jgi:chromosome segregation ATPase
MSRQREISHKFKPIGERLNRLTSYINQYEAYLKNKAKYDKYLEDYNVQLPWKKKTFAEKNKGIVDNYNASKSFIEAVLNKEKRVPVNAWKKEHEKLTAENRRLNGEYKSLKNEVDRVDKIRVSVYDILKKDRQIGRTVWSHGMEL